MPLPTECSLEPLLSTLQAKHSIHSDTMPHHIAIRAESSESQNTYKTQYSYNKKICTRAYGRPYSNAMFPLSCACVRTHIGREMSAHKKTWSAHKFSFKKCFCTYFIHAVLNIDECW